MPLWGFAICFLCATLWAASPIMANRGIEVSKCTNHEINPIRSLFFFGASLVMALILTGGRITLIIDPLCYLYFFISVVLGYIVGDMFYFAAMRTIGLSLAIPVANAYPVFVTLTSWLILDEAATPRIFAGVAVVVAGVLILRLGTDDGKRKEEGPMKRAITPGKGRVLRGFILAVSAGVCWAVGAPFTKLSITSSGLTAAEVTFYRSSVFLIVAWGWRLFVARSVKVRVKRFRDIPLKGWFYFMGTSIIGLCFGSIIYVYCISVMPLAVVTAITSTSPFMAALFSHFVVKERLRPVQWFGVVIIILGSVVVGL